jgi:uncharacterized protein YqeY
MADSTTVPASPLLAKLKGDLKTAMKAKDTNRLNVLRGLIAEVTNSAKTSHPIKSDMQLLSIIRSRTTAAKAASKVFKSAGREDLVEKEQAQIEVLDEYAGSVPTMAEADIKKAVQAAVDEVKAAAPSAKVTTGDVSRRILGPGGSLEGKTVDRSEVARIVREVVG